MMYIVKNNCVYELPGVLSMSSSCKKYNQDMILIKENCKVHLVGGVLAVHKEQAVELAKAQKASEYKPTLEQIKSMEYGRYYVDKTGVYKKEHSWVVARVYPEHTFLDEAQVLKEPKNVQDILQFAIDTYEILNGIKDDN